MATQRFIPEIWSAQLLEALRRNIVYPLGVNPNPVRITQQVPRTRLWLLARKIFTTVWMRAHDFGFRHDFLEHVDCSDCNGDIQPTVSAFTYVTHPNPDYDPEYNAEHVGETISIPSKGRP